MQSFSTILHRHIPGAIRACMLVSLCWGLGSLCPTRAADGWEGNILSLTWENDAVALTDRHYTQGARIGWWSRDDRLPGFMKWTSRHLPVLGMKNEAEKWGLAVGQDMYTPEDLNNPNLILNDRPYAGWFFASIGLQRRGAASSNWVAMETLALDLGVVGPESLAEQTQKTWHGVDPAGWEHQLKTEIGGVLRYDRKYRLEVRRSPDRFLGLDFIPHCGAGVGTIATYLTAGPMFRFGINLPDEFSAATGHDAPAKLGVYLFTGVDGRLNLQNIFLDGNTFVDSHSVNSEPLVGTWYFGLTFVYKFVEMTVGHTFLTREFEQQETRDSFSTGRLTIKF